MSIQQRLKKIREELGLNQQKFAETLGLQRGNYAQIELGNQKPTLEVISRIVKIYNTSYEWIIDGNISSETNTGTQNDLSLLLQERLRTIETQQKLIDHMEERLEEKDEMIKHYKEIIKRFESEKGTDPLERQRKAV